MIMAGQMAQPVTCLPYKHEDQYFTTTTKTGMVAQCQGGKKTGTFWGSQVNQNHLPPDKHEHV